MQNPPANPLFRFVVALVLCFSLIGCGASSTSDDDDSDSTTDDTSSGSTDTSSSDNTASVTCDEETDMEQTVCAANAFLATLTTAEQSTVQLDWSDSHAKTVWSNLPGVTRNGLKLGALSATSRAAALGVAKAALSDAGYTDFQGLLAADDYLGTKASGYSSDNYYIAFIGIPDVAGDWMLQIGGHHLAYNITYLSGKGYPVPNHMGAEPKASFTLNSSTYAPLKDEGDALVAMFNGLSSSELSGAYLSGESYADVLVGPDNGSAVLPTDYPSGSQRRGMLVSDLTDAQQTLVTAAIKQWVNDYPSNVADELLQTYTSAESYADTYIAWAGTQSSGVNVDVAGTYMRIDGPRLWIELVCQNGIVISGKTHYHTMFRDKTMDYGNSL